MEDQISCLAKSNLGMLWSQDLLNLQKEVCFLEKQEFTFIKMMLNKKDSAQMAKCSS